ncbi:hypothetical protein BDN72DRAFT_907576 [Pluteus cervinus]|uniref:Uncharacterized protein n=1 Tax=Pluteus cervinus TaxID=181527 RepID=A0ACD2ZW24_9AGAR|nr:hypothetical protein BDN72DRAFT_907576 [Pluteus cervinus]
MVVDTIETTSTNSSSPAPQTDFDNDSPLPPSTVTPSAKSSLTTILNETPVDIVQPSSQPAILSVDPPQQASTLVLQPVPRSLSPPLSPMAVDTRSPPPAVPLSTCSSPLPTFDLNDLSPPLPLMAVGARSSPLYPVHMDDNGDRRPSPPPLVDMIDDDDDDDRCSSPPPRVYKGKGKATVSVALPTLDQLADNGDKVDQTKSGSNPVNPPPSMSLPPGRLSNHHQSVMQEKFEAIVELLLEVVHLTDNRYTFDQVLTLFSRSVGRSVGNVVNGWNRYQHYFGAHLSQELGRSFGLLGEISVR